MTVVIDASAAIEIALNKEASEAFGKRLDEADVVLAPDTFPAEVTNVFWKYGHLANLPVDKCRTGISYCLELVDDFVDTRNLWREVFSESMKLKHSAYDIFYLVVARRNHAVVLTRDGRLMEAAAQMGVEVVDT